MTDEIMRAKVDIEFGDETKSLEDIFKRLDQIIEDQESQIDIDEYDRIIKINDTIQEDIDYFIDKINTKVSFEDEERVLSPVIDREFMEELAHTMKTITNKAMQYAYDTEFQLETFWGPKFDPSMLEEPGINTLNEKPGGGFWTAPLSSHAGYVSEWQLLSEEEEYYSNSEARNEFKLFKRKKDLRVREIKYDEDLIELSEEFSDKERFDDLMEDMFIYEERNRFKTIDWGEFYEDYDAINVSNRAIRTYDVESSHWKNLDVLEDLGTFKVYEGVRSLSKKSSEAIIEIKRKLDLPIYPEDVHIKTPRHEQLYEHDQYDTGSIGGDISVVQDELMGVNDNVSRDIGRSKSDVFSENNLDNVDRSSKQSFIPQMKYHTEDNTLHDRNVIDLTKIDIGSIAKELTINLGVLDTSSKDGVQISSKIRAIVNNYLIEYVKQLFTIAEIYR